MTKTRRILAVVCIAVLVVTAMVPPAGVDLSGILVVLGPLFGTVVNTPLREPNVAALGHAPSLGVRVSRAPPLA